MTRRPVAVAIVISITHASKEKPFVGVTHSCICIPVYEELTPIFFHAYRHQFMYSNSMYRCAAASLLTMLWARESDTGHIIVGGENWLQTRRDQPLLHY